MTPRSKPERCVSTLSDIGRTSGTAALRARQTMSTRAEMSKSVDRSSGSWVRCEDVQCVEVRRVP
jgi:hypothetical protein